MLWLYLLLVVAVIWLAALTVLLAALIRHIGTLQLAVEAGGLNSGETFDIDNDGPVVGSELPKRTLDLLREQVTQSDNRGLVAVFLSTSCVACRKRTSDIVQRNEGLDRVIFLVTGTDPMGLQRLRELFAEADSRVIYDPGAHEIARSLNINSTPFAFAFADETITGKAYLRSADDFHTLINDTSQSPHDAGVEAHS